MQLLDETGGLTFTVQDVVDRSKLSLRSFYQTFASKDDLLLALFEEYVATAAVWQRDRMAKHDDPIEQIRVFLTSLWSRQAAAPTSSARSRSTTSRCRRPVRATSRTRWSRSSTVLLEAVERGIASGQVRDDIDSRRLAEILLHTGNAAVQHHDPADRAASRPTTCGRSAWAVCARESQG